MPLTPARARLVAAGERRVGGAEGSGLKAGEDRCGMSEREGHVAATECLMSPIARVSVSHLRRAGEAGSAARPGSPQIATLVSAMRYEGANRLSACLAQN